MTTSVATAQNTTTEPQVHFLEYLRILRIRKTHILGVFLLVLLSSVVVTLLMQPTYQGRVQIAVRKDVKDITPIGNVFQRDPGFDPYFINTEFKKIQSTSVLYPVVEDPKLNLIEKWSERLGLKGSRKLTRQEAYKYLLNHMDVDQIRNTSLIEIRVYSPDPVEAAEVANAIAESYKRWRTEVQNEHVQKGLQILKERLDEQDKIVAQLQARLDEIRNKYGIPDVIANTVTGYGTSPERERVSALAQELTRAESDYVNFKSRYDQLIQLTNSLVQLRESVLIVMPYETILPQLISSLNTVEQNLASLDPNLGPQHPQVRQAMSLKSKIEEQIQRRINGILEGLRASVEATKQRMDRLQQALDEGKSEVAKQAQQWSEYFLAKRDLENQQKVRDALLLRLRSEEIDLAIPSESTVQIITPAEPEPRPVSPKWALNLAAGGLLGLLAGVLVAFFVEYLDISVKTIDDVERALGTSVIAVIPQGVGSLIKDGPDCWYAEAYRVLRTNLLFSRKDPMANTFCVVSGGAGEGKTTTVANLAVTFAQAGDRVLLVDSDLRRPALHKYFGVSNNIGLTDFLLGQKSLEEVIQTTPLANLDFLPSGKLPSSALGVLNSERMKQFIEEVKARYDFVLLDSPPIMGVSDASIISRLVDASIQVVQYRKYPQVMTVRAKNMIEKIGGNLIGVVLNNINISQDSYYYYYSGYYYDYYYSSQYSRGDYYYGGYYSRRRRRHKKSSSQPVENAEPIGVGVQQASADSKKGDDLGRADETGEGLGQKF